MTTATDLIDPEKLYWYTSSSGALEFQLPGECIIDCAHAGECYHDCDYWIDNLDLNLDIAKVRSELLEYGAWTEDELIEKGERETMIILLWCAANDISDLVYSGDYQD